MLDLKRFCCRVVRVPTETVPETGSYQLRYYDATDWLDAKKRAMRYFGRDFMVTDVWLYSNSAYGTDS